LDIPGADIEHLTVEQKVEYYLEHDWTPLYNQIVSQSVTNKLFDMGVLFGIGSAVKALQRALDMTPDGIFGLHTLAAVNLVNATLLLNAFKTELHEHAQSVAAANPNEAPFLPDWTRRIDS
jgi:lysozyme family protein